MILNKFLHSTMSFLWGLLMVLGGFFAIGGFLHILSHSYGLTVHSGDEIPMVVKGLAISILFCVGGVFMFRIGKSMLKSSL